MLPDDLTPRVLDLEDVGGSDTRAHVREHAVGARHVDEVDNLRAKRERETDLARIDLRGDPEVVSGLDRVLDARVLREEPHRGHVA